MELTTSGPIGPMTLAAVQQALERMEAHYRMKTSEFLNNPDPTRLVPEDDAVQWAMLAEHRSILCDLNKQANSDNEWTPPYQCQRDTDRRLPAVDREEVEWEVAA